ncbi:MAG: STAS domain-containing protein [Nocardioidaceae bacterium]
MTVLHRRTEPNTLVLAVGGRVRPEDVQEVVAAAAQIIRDDDSEQVVLDLTLLQSRGLSAVDVVVQIQLAARRQGHCVGVRNAAPEMQRLLAFVGLGDLLPPVEA